MSKMNWTEEEIDFLRKAYREGLSLKDMGYFLKRSVTAVNKALYRFSAREKESRLKKSKVLKGEGRHEIMKSIMNSSQRGDENLAPIIFEDFGQKTHLKEASFSNVADMQGYLSLEMSEKSVFQEENLYEENDYNNFSSSYERFKKKKISYGHLEAFVFFEDVLRWLNQKGFMIEKIHQDFFLADHPQIPGALYKIISPKCEKETSHSFKTEAQLLLFANKVRLKESLPLFYVFDVTAE